ncbi:hypothetical protein EWM64_g10057 [Hericium alpestre]|uniref:Uncharacterized protein n=1 Tax=Hericium alpestre TaxID=135208 RepID=A0A4Y9ZGT6_9AGAM|nr:hypothetical protein EWM64_g10057 [Hericium alpestre]
MQKAIAQCSALPISFEVEFRPFLLHPDLPDEGLDKLEWFYRKIGKAKFDSIMEMAIQQGENVGISFSFQGKIAQTTRAHRLMNKALQIGGSPKQLELVRLLFKAYMEEEQDIADMAMLSEMAECAGVMSKDDAIKFLDSDELLEEVMTQVAEARGKGVTGVPFTIIDGKWAVSGGQMAPVYVKIFNKLASAQSGPDVQCSKRLTNAYLLSFLVVCTTSIFSPVVRVLHFDGEPHYVSEDGTIPYISDIGADILKPLFIVGCSITAVSFVLSLIVERFLRHHGRLYPDLRKRERVFSWLAILASFMGGAGLILLSIFDTKRHVSAHRSFLVVFIVGVALSAIFTIAEYVWLSKDYRDVRQLKTAYILKAIITSILVILAIAFAVELYANDNVGGVLEWVIAFLYTLFLLTFVYDLRLSKGVHKHELSDGKPLAPREPEMQQV